jgi:hypothetical protein
MTEPGGAPSTDQIVVQLLTGAWITQLVAAIARLRVPDELARSQPQSIDELARAVSANPGALGRAMRTLASIDVFKQVDGDRYALTPIGERLRSGTRDSMRDILIAETDEVHLRSWQHVTDAIRTGKPQPKEVLGEDAFEYYVARADEGAQFGRAMENVSVMVAHGVLQTYDFSRARTIVDIGGGNGSFLRAVLKRHPQAGGIVFDLPYIEGPAKENIHADGLTGRARFESGDFFKAVPAGDTYLLKLVLHDWTDQECRRILSNCRKAIAADGRLLIVEALIPENNAPGLAQLMDINMLVMTGGRERTVKEYEKLAADSGFKVSRVVDTGTPLAIVETVPV